MHIKPRVIPVLLLRRRGLVKTIRFKEPTYLGDPINVVRIFNDKEVDELFFLDIEATVAGQRPPFELLSQITAECFVPLGYGGGLRTLEDVRTILGLGVEKVAINSYAAESPDFIRQAADLFGSQAIVVAMDVKRDLLGQARVFTQAGRKNTGQDPRAYAQLMEAKGAGELLVNSIDRDGTMQGYDLDLLRSITSAVSIPVVACGGAGRLDDFAAAVKRGGASAVAAGSLFVFQGRHRAVLISYPSYEAQCRIFDPGQTG